MHKILKMVADASPLRTTHFILIYFLGYVVATRNIANLLNSNLLLGILATMFGWFFIVSINNYFDKEHDKKSNPHRGFPQEAYSGRELLFFTFSSLLIGILFSLFLSLQSFIFYSLFVLLGYLYSCPGVYLKRYGIKSVIIGLGSGLVFGMGFFTLPSEFTRDFWFLFLLVMIIFSAGSVINDLKDVEADRDAGVITPYTVFGRKGGKIATMLFLLLAFTLPSFIAPQGFHIFSLLAILSAALLWFEKVKLIYLAYFLEYLLLLYFLL